MVLVRVLLLAFNVAIVTFLVYRLLQIYKSDMPKKGWLIAIGIFLLLLPAIVLVGFIKATAIYMLIYPIALSLFVYLIKMYGRE